MKNALYLDAETRRRRREERDQEGRHCECGGLITGGKPVYYAGQICDCGCPKAVTEAKGPNPSDLYRSLQRRW